jgi:hypothetical protein
MFLYQLDKNNKFNYRPSKTRKLSNSYINLEHLYKVPICGHIEIG